MFNKYPPVEVLKLYRRHEAYAWNMFRAARWDGTNTHRVVDCPWCKARALKWGNRHFGKKQTRWIMRWWCRSFEQRQVDNQRWLAKYKCRTSIRRKVPPKRFDGCGRRFSDLSKTPFHHRQIRMSEWMMLIKGGPLALRALHEAGVSAARCVAMATVLCTVAKSDQAFMDRLQYQSNLPTMKVLKILLKRGAKRAKT